MKKPVLYALAVVPAAFVVATSAHAQKPSSGISVEAGGNFLTDSDLKDFTKSTGFRVALGYDLPMTQRSANSATYKVGLSYAENKDHGNKFDSWGLTLDGKYRLDQKTSTKGGPYVGLGIGVFRNQLKGDNTIISVPESTGQQARDLDTIDGTDKKTTIGGRAFLGYDFSQFYVEASYNLNGKIDGARADSVSLSLGIHF